MPERIDNIHPVFDRLLDRPTKERRLNQRGLVIWMYGLSGSGKSTLANALERKLFDEGVFTQVLDGDNIRTGLNNNLGFTDEDRTENIRRIAEVAKLFAQAGIVTLTSFITPKKELRANARSIVGDTDFIEVYVKASFQTCEARDVKGLYAKAREGKIKNFTGRDSNFEEPEKADLIIDTNDACINSCVEVILDEINPRIRL